MFSYRRLFMYSLLLIPLFISESEEQRTSCWTRQKCDACARRSRIGGMSICCKDCGEGKMTVRVTRKKVFCWCQIH